MTTPAPDQRCRVGLFSLQFSANPDIRSRLLATPSTVLHVSRAPTATHLEQRSAQNVQPVLTAARPLLLHWHHALLVPLPRSVTSQVPLMHLPAACALQAPTLLFRVQPHARLAQLGLMLSLTASSTATCAEQVHTDHSSAPVRERFVVCVPLEHFPRLDL